MKELYQAIKEAQKEEGIVRLCAECGSLINKNNSPIIICPESRDYVKTFFRVSHGFDKYCAEKYSY